MTAPTLRDRLEAHFGQTATLAKFAAALGVHRSLPFRWLTNGGVPVPGYALSALELAEACPDELLPERWKKPSKGDAR